MTGEVRLDDGKYGQMAFRTQQNRNNQVIGWLRGNFCSLTMVRGYDFHRLGGYLGNPGSSHPETLPMPVSYRPSEPVL